MKSSLSCSVKSQQLKIHLVAGMKHLFWKWWWEGGADLSVILTSKKKKKGGGTTSIFKILIRTGGGNLRLIFLVKFKISYQLRKKGGGSSEKIFVFVI